MTEYFKTIEDLHEKQYKRTLESTKKASELLKELQKNIETFGDYPVVIDNCNFSSGYIKKYNHIEKIDDCYVICDI